MVVPLGQDKAALIDKTQAYLNKWTPNSPLTGQMIVEASIANNFPIDLILTVCHAESHCGTKGRAVETKNPFNVGNTDFGDWKTVVCGVANWCLDDWSTGLAQFINLIKGCYFDEGETISINTYMERNFRAVRCNIAGGRYMTDINAKSKYLELLNKPNGVLEMLK